MNSLAKKMLLVIVLLGSSSGAFAKSNDLKVMVRTIYPQHLSTVNDLMQFILEGTGYRVYVGKNAPEDARDILRQKIPYQRKGVLMSRANALLMAIGDENSIVVDYDNKLVSVTRSPTYED